MRRLVTVLSAVAVLSLSAAAESLWPAGGGSLFADNKAFRVGDVVTITVDETATVANSSTSSASKTSKTDAAVEAAVMPTGLETTKSLFGAEKPVVTMDSTRTFSGSGAFNVAGSVKTSITATVKEVLPNGNLVIEGRRVRTSVDETIEVLISGIARPEDITTNNTINSASLAEANIIVKTSGPLHRSNKRGWLGRILDIAWPF